MCFNGLEYFAFAFWAIGGFVLINIVFHLRLKSSKYDCLQEEKGVIQFYSEIYVPDDEDNSVKEYIRMRDDQKLMLKKIKQQILAFVLRQGKKFEGGKTYWTIAHVKWLKALELPELAKETLQEYLNE